jgi:hypothetical protein
MKPLPGYLASELIGRTYLGLPEEDGRKLRMRIIKAIEYHKEALKTKLNEIKTSGHIKFLVNSDDNKCNEIISYNELLDHLQRNEIDSNDLDEGMMRLKAITSHEGPLTSKHPNY